MCGHTVLISHFPLSPTFLVAPFLISVTLIYTFEIQAIGGFSHFDCMPTYRATASKALTMMVIIMMSFYWDKIGHADGILIVIFQLLV